MASLSDSAQELEARILAVPVDITWTTPDDLARLALDAMGSREAFGRQMISTGMLHIGGDGVRDSTARLEAVADVMRHFQRLVTATGAARAGHKNLCLL